MVIAIKIVAVASSNLICVAHVKSGRRLLTFRRDDNLKILDILSYSIREVPVFISKILTVENEQQDGDVSDMETDEFSQ